MKFRSIAVAMMSLALLGGCAKFNLFSKSKKPAKEDAPLRLVDFKPTLDVDRVWQSSVGGDKPVLRLGLGLGLDGQRIYASGHGGDIIALDLKTGRQIWRKDTKIALTGGTGAGGGLVLAGSANGDVVALRETDGSKVWQVKVGGEVLSAPAASDKIVVVRTVDGRLHGLNPADGKELWREEQPIPRLTLRGAATPVIVGDAVYSGFDNGKVVALAVNDGSKLWEAAVTQPRGRTELDRLVDIDAPLRVLGEDVFAVAFQGRVAMLARESGQVWWSREMSSYRGLDADDDSVVISTAEGAVVLLGRRTGAETWRNADFARRRLSAPALVGGYVVVVDLEGIAHWLDRSTGTVVAREKVGDAVSTAPLSIDGMLVLRTDKGRIVAYRPGARSGVVAEAAPSAAPAAAPAADPAPTPPSN